MAKAPTPGEHLKRVKQWFDRSTKVLNEADSGFAPKPGMLTVAQHVAHVAQTIDWFVAGACSPSGMTTDFESMGKEIMAVTSLKKAKAWLSRAVTKAAKCFDSMKPADWKKAIKGEIMTGEPRAAILAGIEDHTAHHRGSLVVYARLLDRVPPMPYM